MIALSRLTVLVLALIAASASAEAPAKVRRFAFLAGANDGGGGRARLRYATTDARAVSRVLTEMGGVRPSDVIFADEPDRGEFLRQLEGLRRVVAASRVPDVRIELIFYYSGHSDEEGLLLHGERLPYPELRALIEQIPADVRVAVLDSCASGALTRHKGGIFRPPFMTDDSVKLKGNAFLASSAANEVAQESDRISASFFTHFLVSGLRGAADVNRDRRVTFFEAYQFASQETLARTERTQGGAQHAAYDISLNGTGDLVMTDVRATSAGLVLAADLQGFISVREPDSRLVAELRKAPGHPVELGLEPGRYLVTMAGKDSAFEATVELREGQRAEVGQLQFRPRPLELARARGDDPTLIGAPVLPLPPPRVVPFSVGVIPMPSSGPADRVLKNVSLNLIADRAAQVRGLQLSVGVNWVDEELHGVQAAVAANISSGSVSGLQASAGGNVARGDLHGIQASAAVNLAFADVHGLKATAGANYVQGHLVGLQAASGINLGMSGGRGLQAAAGANWMARDFTGAQFAAGFNGVGGTLRGIQGGVVNYGAEVQGTQVGIVNVARVSRGLQLGLVNISEEDQGVPIGLISYARRNGMLHLVAYGSETGTANAGLKIGGRSVYNSFIVGVRPGRNGNRFATSLGLGVRARPERPWLSFLDTEVAAGTFNHDFVGDTHRLQIVSSLRLIGGWRLAQRLAIVAGPTLNVLVRKRGFDTDIAPGPLESVLHDGPTRVSLYPGFILGVEI
jgi:hypothetical protein